MHQLRQGTLMSLVKRSTLALRRLTGRRLDHTLDYLLRRVEFRRQMDGPSQTATFGRGTYGGTVLCYGGDEPGSVSVGNYCSIADGVEFMIGENHRTDWVSTFPFRVRFGLHDAHRDGHPRGDGNIVVGNDVWIGHHALIMSGVTIGDGAVIAARAVVTRDVPAYTIVAGVPAKPLRARFPEDDIAALLALRWWDWPEEELLTIVDLLNGPDVHALLVYGRARGSVEGGPPAGIVVAPRRGGDALTQPGQRSPVIGQRVAATRP